MTFVTLLEREEVVESNLLKWGKFTSHSGQSLDYKIECDALTPEDLECIAQIVSKAFHFTQVIGIPSGGLALANVLQKYCYKETDKLLQHILIVDDVMTTGKSMQEYMSKYTNNVNVVKGFAIFDRMEASELMFDNYVFSMFKVII